MIPNDHIEHKCLVIQGSTHMCILCDLCESNVQNPHIAGHVLMGVMAKSKCEKFQTLLEKMEH